MIINNKNIFLTCVFLQYDIDSDKPNYCNYVINNDHVDEVVYMNIQTSKFIDRKPELQILGNNVLFISDFLQQYFQFYHLLYRDEVLNLEGNNILVVRRNYSENKLVDEELLIVPMVQPDPLSKYENDLEEVFINNFADTFLCLRPNPETNLLWEAAEKAFQNKYPNVEINWNDIPAHLRLQIDGIYEENNLSLVFQNEDPIYFNINDYVDYKEN